MKRDILNYLVKKLRIRNSDGTSEEIWSKNLLHYAIPPAQVIPPNVTPRQIRQALILSGVSMQMIDGAIAALPEPRRVLPNNYEYLHLLEQILVIQIGQALLLDSEQIDNL